MTIAPLPTLDQVSDERTVRPEHESEFRIERRLSIVRTILFVLFVMFGPLIEGIDFFSLSFILLAGVIVTTLMTSLIMLWLVQYYRPFMKYAFVAVDLIAVAAVILLAQQINQWVSLAIVPLLTTFCLLYRFRMFLFSASLFIALYTAIYYIGVLYQGIYVSLAETVFFAAAFTITGFVSALASSYQMRQQAGQYAQFEKVEQELIKTKEEILNIRAINRALETDLRSRIEEVKIEKDESEQRRLQSERRAWEMATIHNVSAAVNVSVDLNEILQITVEKLSRILDIERVDLLMFDKGDDIGYIRATYGRESNQFMKIGTGVVDKANKFYQFMANLKRPIALEQTTRLRDEWVLLRKLMKEQGFTALLLLPIIVKEEVIGIVQLNETRRDKVFSPQEVNLCETLIEQASGAIERGMLVQETIDKSKELEKANTLIEAEIMEKSISELRLAQLAKLANTILSELDLAKVFDMVAHSIVHYCGFERCLISTLNHDGESAVVGYAGLTAEDVQIATQNKMTKREREFAFNPVFQISQSFYLPKEIPFRAVESKLPTPEELAKLVQRRTWDDNDYLFVPFFSSSKKLMGFISLDQPNDNMIPNAKKLEPIEAFAQQVTFAIEHVHIYDALQSKLEEIQEAYDQLLEVDQLKTDFLSVVSHELRTPLTSIKSFTEILIDEIENDEEAEQSYLRFLNIIDQEADRLTALITDMLSLQEIHEGKYAWKSDEFDFAKLLRDVSRKQEPMIKKKNIDYTLNIADDIPLFIGDRLKIKESLENLINNAHKFTAKDGVINVQLYSTETNIVFKVRDTGEGIPKEKLATIFDKFRQVDGSAKRKSGGVGLGLALVKEVVEHHRGRIDIKSEVNVGSEFTVTLPRTDLT